MPTLNNSPRYPRIFTQIQTTSTSNSAALRTVNNTTGTWDATAAKLIRAPQGGSDFNPQISTIPVPWLTGTRSMQPGVRGRKSGSVTFRNIPLIPPGAAGTVPDIDHILTNIFGAAATIVASTSATYNFVDTGNFPLTLFLFTHGSTTLSSMYAWGAFCTGFELRFNGDVFVGDFTFACGYTMDSNTWSGEDTTAKAGITVIFPAEPASPSYNGSIINGFGATVALDGNQMQTTIRSLTIRGTTGFQLVGDIIADGYPAISVGGVRAIGVSVGLIDDDSAALTNLKVKARANTAPTIPISITLGSVAGSKFKFDLAGVQPGSPGRVEEENLIMMNFPDSPSHASAIGVTDDFVWACL